MQNYHVLISPADLSNAYYRFKQTTCPSLPQFISHPIVVTKPEAAATNDADIPTYAAMCSQPPSLMNDSSSSLSSIESIYTTEENDAATLNYYKQTDEPPKAHCRNRNNIFEQPNYNPFLRH